MAWRAWQPQAGGARIPPSGLGWWSQPSASSSGSASSGGSGSLSAAATEKLVPGVVVSDNRGCEPHLLTHDVGRLFLGMDLRGCQCHNYPLVNACRQADYYGLC